MSKISRLLSDAGLALKKGLGQNFLVNQGALDKIAQSVGADENTFLIEIGCGLGNLTDMLAKHAGSVLAIELDQRFRPIHERHFGHLPNVRFHYGDFMEFDLDTIPTLAPGLEPRVIGNIPYHLTSPILFKLLASRVDFSAICLLMQREVAQRLSANPGDGRDHGILAVKTRSRYETETLFSISPGSFLPPPRVHSALARLTPRAGGPLVAGATRRRDFFNFIDAAFAQRRKLLAKSLTNASIGKIARVEANAALEAMALDPATVRAETLSCENFLELFDALGAPSLPTLRKQYDS